MNYAYTDAILDYFVKKEIPLNKMVSELNNQLMLYRDQTNQVQFNVLDSHDTARLLTAAQGNRDLMRQVMAFTYLQPGVPCLYYGDEYGMTGGNDPDCRKCLVWDADQQDLELYQFVKALIAVRKQYQPILSEGQLKWSIKESAPDVLKMTRILGNKKLTAIFNTGQTTVSLTQTQPVILSQQITLQEQQVQMAPNGFILY